MKIHQRMPEDDLEMDMSPMIDMVFLLLIFFLVASTIIDEKVQIEPPEAVFAKVPDDITNRAMITVDKDENIYFEKEQEPITLEELRTKLDEAYAFYLEDMENIPPKARKPFKAMIRSDGRVKYKVNERITRVCGNVGISTVVYAAYEKMAMDK